FWTNLALALALHGAGRRPGGDPAPALAYYRKALEIRPHAVAVQNDLGVVLFDRHWMYQGPEGGPGSLTVFAQVMKSYPQFAPGFNNFGLTLKTIGHWP